MRKIVFIVSSLLVFAVFNYAIWQKERIKAEGETVLLELAPVDPRSLMQGDYMVLRYAIENGQDFQGEGDRGDIVIAIDENKVGSFKRFHMGGDLAPGEKLFHVHNRYGGIRIVPDSFMFQEGHAQHYDQAKYGVFKFDPKGSHILVGLANEQREVIQPE